MSIQWNLLGFKEDTDAFVMRVTIDGVEGQIRVSRTAKQSHDGWPDFEFDKSLAYAAISEVLKALERADAIQLLREGWVLHRGATLFLHLEVPGREDLKIPRPQATTRS